MGRRWPPRELVLSRGRPRASRRLFFSYSSDAWAQHLRPEVTLPVEPKPEYHRLVNEFDLVDQVRRQYSAIAAAQNLSQSARTFLKELGELDAFVESLTVNRHAQDADGSTQERPRVAALRFQGLREIEAVHGRNSPQYAKASQTFRGVLEVRRRSPHVAPAP